MSKKFQPRLGRATVLAILIVGGLCPGGAQTPAPAGSMLLDQGVLHFETPAFRMS